MSAYDDGLGAAEFYDLADWREQPAEGEWPDEIENAAYQGLAGEIIEVIAPHTEASRVALLVHLLTFFGNAAGRASHCRGIGNRPLSSRVCAHRRKIRAGKKRYGAQRHREAVRVGRPRMDAQLPAWRAVFRRRATPPRQ
jgi:hypothetical protein